ncbi:MULTISPECIES: PH domain-containing protein [Actinomadura]|uniref:PH domain-containing protein n=2 Tax=Actinomadura madurae TaxID=1993 RepID=A0A1I5A3E0_9ACTN|nr:PH domain-containing protein [Actinomadura madurae]MCP9965629.1 PH domain-containing protein [Actinomadura madurae]MCP9978104.1 PH domain-containing protein [Actinomadura madurae]MCQ0010382.1 PH domain-containing protein [Actinomadura madurae]MCQ0014303.1 PH domain-containing protein [Actinomadura madurae]URM94466.1 PH domain-containing protein [Actinomadura madurae]
MGDRIEHDRSGQLKQIESGLLPGEQIIAVYDAIGAGTGFIGLTDRRVIVQDKSFAGKRYAITSVPYSKITSVSVVSNKSWAGSYFSTGSIAINVGTHTYEVEFRGADKSHHVHNVILQYISG